MQVQDYPKADYRRASGPHASFAERAARDPNFGYDDDDDDELYTVDDKPLRPLQSDTPMRPPYKQNTAAHRVREPQAALHVPKPRIYRPDLDLSSPERDAYSAGQRHKHNLHVSTDYPRGPVMANQPRKGSIPDRSPLQKLEGKLDGISKDEKRARMEEAEHRAGQRAGRQQQRISSDRHHPNSIPPLANDAAQRRVLTDPTQRRHISGKQGREAPYNQGASDAQRLGGVRPVSGIYQEGQQGRQHSDHTHLPDDGVDRRNSQRRSYPQSARLSQDLDSPTAAAFAAVTIGDGVLTDQDRRHSQQLPGSRFPQQAPGVSRSDSKKLQKRNMPRDFPTEYQNPLRIPASQQQFANDRNGHTRRKSLTINNHDDSIHSPPLQDVRSKPEDRLQSPYGSVQSPASANSRRFNNNMPPVSPNEWRSAETAKLELDDLALDDAITRSPTSAGGHAIPRRESVRRTSVGYDGTYGEPSRAGYQPPLLVNCGPLLRYKGLRREKRHSPQGVVIQREIWRGSVMIVTSDNSSSYSTPPILKLFAQPMDLLPPFNPTHDQRESHHEYVDPVAGEIKPSRTGHSMYVKPIEALPESIDLSQDESENGLFETFRSSANRSRLRSKDGEKVGKFRQVQGVRLHQERGMTFWRFSIEVELGISQARIAYRINNGPATGFWVPARGSAMNIMFHSCNGFSHSVDPNTFSGPDPLWRDVLNSHAMRPFHVMLGGGDQIYNDRVMHETELFKQWLQVKNSDRKNNAEFTKAMQNELETFYLNRYAMWFSRGIFSLANSQIPMVNLWDDHDIIDGYGSYPDHFMRSPVFTGLGNVAYKYYMLFQHQAVPAESFHDEPSWILGASPGPYIHHHSRNVFMFLGRRVAFLGLDCRTERKRDEILTQSTYDLIFNRCRAEIIKGETKHLIVLLTVPIAYPRLNFLENILTSKAMDPVKAIGRTGALGGFVNKFDGGVEILDDLDDHWTAKHHKQERNWFIQELQELAAEKSVRITILGGDVHLGAVGQFYSRKSFGIPKDQDHRYMPNVVSSAIVNTPPPIVMSDILNRRNKVHHLDDETDEDMIPMFSHDVDGKSRNNKTLLPRRNYCTIREYLPGTTPPHSPMEEQPPKLQKVSSADKDKRKFPPGSMGRSRSVTRETFRPRSLIRRLSGSRSRDEAQQTSRDRDNESLDGEPVRRRFSFGGRTRASREEENDDSYFREEVTAANTKANAAANPTQEPIRPINTFHRRLTDPSVRKPAEGLDEPLREDTDEINLEGGLDICLNMEASQQDPSGITVPYRLLVPALFYGGPQDVNTTRFRTRRASLLDRMRGRRFSRQHEEYSDDGSGSERSRSPSPRRGDLAGPRHDSRHRPLHPDDRLQFADAAPPQDLALKQGDERRDSRVGSMNRGGGPPNAGHDAGHHEQEPYVRANDNMRANHEISAAVRPGDDREYYSDEEFENEGPRKKLGFLGSLKRRFSSRGQPQRDYYSDEQPSDSGSDRDTDIAQQPHNANARPPGPYRAADEHIFRNDARLPSGGAGRPSGLDTHGNVQDAVPRRSTDGPANRGLAGKLNRLSDRVEDRLVRNQQARQQGQQPQSPGRAIADAPQSHNAQSPHHAHAQDFDDRPSEVLSSMDSFEAAPPRPRRPSKAERFFGLDQPDGRRPEARPGNASGYHNQGYDDGDGYYEDGYGPPRRKGWKIWQRS